jgi:hypothetical protein
MSIIEDISRPFWLMGLNQVSGPKLKGIGGWICDEEYQVYTPVTRTSFVLSFGDGESLLDAFAGDINRIGSASFESAVGIVRTNPLRKSTAWLIIKTYYSAFFSAHALLRMFGESCTPIKREQVNSIEKVANLFGTSPPSPMTCGLYHLRCDMKANKIFGASLSGSPHEVFWKLFHGRVLQLSNDVLSLSTESLVNRQLASAKFSELAANLSLASAGSGRWLSTIRNAVNYDQKYATWYPYSGEQKYQNRLFEKVSEWNGDPMEIDLTSHQEKDLRRFQATCNFIIAVFRSSAVEMSRRCSAGRSFHEYGTLACLNLANRAS